MGTRSPSPDAHLYCLKYERYPNIDGGRSPGECVPVFGSGQRRPGGAKSRVRAQTTGEIAVASSGPVATPVATAFSTPRRTSFCIPAVASQALFSSRSNTVLTFPTRSTRPHSLFSGSHPPAPCSPLSFSLDRLPASPRAPVCSPFQHATAGLSYRFNPTKRQLFPDPASPHSGGCLVCRVHGLEL